MFTPKKLTPPKPSHIRLKVRSMQEGGARAGNLLFGTSALTRAVALTLGVSIVGASTERAVAATWVGGTSKDYSNTANWSGAPGGNNDYINTATGNFPVISSTVTSFTPVDLHVGSGSGAVGRLDETAGFASTGNGNWFFIGDTGGTGTFNMANTAVTGTGISGYGLGSGSFTTGRLTIGGGEYNGTGTGTVNINTTGVLTLNAGNGGNNNVSLDLGLGSASTGTLNLENGTINSTYQIFVGDGSSNVGTGGTGILNMSGGLITAAADIAIGQGSLNRGTLNMTGGTITTTGEFWVENANAANVTGSASASISGGSTLNVGQWLVVGRSGANSSGTMSIANSTVNVNTGNTISGALHANIEVATYDSANGTLNISGTSAVNVDYNGSIILGSQNTSGKGTINQNGGTVTLYSDNGVTVGGAGVLNVGGATSSGVFTYNLNGGTLTVPSIQKSSTTGQGIFNFNGGTLRSSSATAAFMQGLTSANVLTGGAIIDTNGFNDTIAQPLITGTSTDGGLTKLSAGTLTLTGNERFNGPLNVNAGSLALTATSSVGAVTIQGGAGLALTSAAANSTLLRSTSFTLGVSGSTSSVSINFNNFNPAAPIVSTGAISLNGTDLFSFSNGGLLSSGIVTLIGGSSLTGSGILNPSGPITLGARTTGVLGETGSSVILTVSASIPVWTGSVNSNWDIDTTGSGGAGTPNWQVNGVATTYRQAASGTDSVIFNDTAVSTATNVNLVAQVSPTAITASNSVLNYNLVGTGGIDGSGPFNKYGTGIFTIANTGTNDYTGPTNVNAGTLALSSTLSATPITVNSGGAFVENSGGALAGTASIANAGGATTLNGINTNTGATIVSSGSLTLNGALNGSAVNVTGGAFNESSTGTVGGAVAFTNNGGVSNIAGSNTYTGQTNIVSGKLFLTGSIASTSTVAIGNTSGANAAVYQSGAGSLMNFTSSALGDFQIGATPGASGYYNLSAGTINISNLNSSSGGEFDVAGSSGGAGTFGQFDMSGGTVNMPNSGGSYFLANRGGAGETSVLNFTGGTVQIAGGGTPTDNGIDGLAANWTTNQTTTITISGSAQFLTPSLRVKLNVGTGFNGTGNAGDTAVLNLNGGVLQTLGITYTGTNSTVNFNGGKLMAGSAANTSFMTGLVAANVYGGGGTIDNNGQAITVGQALLAVSGSGVSSVPVSAAGSGYITPPQVSFTGGGGSGATGYATIDPNTGALTGIVITSAGQGYTSAPTVTLTGGGGIGASVGTASLAANATTGGMTFQGAGATTLTGSSTYSGPTNLLGGTLAIASAGSINGSSNVVVNGAGAKLLQTSTVAGTEPITLTQGTLDGTGRVGAVTVGNGTGGIVQNGNGSSTSLTIGSLTFTGAATVNATAGSSASPINVLGALSAPGTNGGEIVINASDAAWSNGTDSLIGYGTFTGSLNDFSLGTVTGLNSRQVVGGLVNTGTSIALLVNGDTLVWTGTATNGGLWTTVASGSPTSSTPSWVLKNGHTATDYFPGDVVEFDDTANLGGSSVTPSGNVVLSGDNVSPGSITFNNNSLAYTLSSADGSAIVGPTSITKNGAGLVTISETNSYTGATTINGGTVSVSANNDLGANTAPVTLNGGTLQASTGITNTHPITVGAAGGTINVPTTGQFYIHTANTLLGSGPLTVTGGGTLTQGVGNIRVDVTNTYSGAMTMQQGGIFEYGVAGAVGGGASFILNNEGELAVQTAVSLPNALTVSGSTDSVLSFENGNTGNYTGSITDNGVLTVGLRDWYNYGTGRSGIISGAITGAGGLTLTEGVSTSAVSLTLTGSNTYSGGTTIPVGTVIVGGVGNSALGTGSVLLNGGGLSSTNNNSANFDPTISNAITVGANGGTISSGNGTEMHVNGNISGSGPLGLSGIFNGSALQLNGNNSLYSGTATVTAANTRLGSTSAGSAAASWVVNGNLQTDVTGGGTFQFGALSGTGSIDGHAANASTAVSTLNIGALNTNTTFGGRILDTPLNDSATGNSDSSSNNSLALTKVGTGTLNLMGANTYSGPTTVNGGTLQLSAAGTAGNAAGGTIASAAVNVNNGGTLLLGAHDAIGTSSAVNLNGGTFNAATFSEGTHSGNSLTAGMGNLTLSGASTLDFGAGSTSTDLVFSGGSTSGSYTLSIFNYNGGLSNGTDDGSASLDRLLFASDPGFGSLGSPIASISFYSDNGSTLVGSGEEISFGSGVEVVAIAAVPEPTTILAGLALVGLVGYRERKRISRLLQS